MKFAAFVDIGNLYYTIKNATGQHLDYPAFVDYINGYGEGVITGYGTQIDNEAQAFITMLTKIGVVPKYKRPLTMGKNKYKASWVVGMTVDIMVAAPNVDVIILCTGSGEYTPLVQYLQDTGKKVMVIGYQIARELRLTCEQTMIIPKSFIK